jgi:ABC-type multidrug transport system fused ATPase/permease subunit
MSFYQTHNIGSLSSRVVGDAALISDAMQGTLVNYIATPLAVVSSLIMCLITSWKLTLLIFIGLPLLLFPIAFLARRVKRVSKEIQKNQDRFSSVLIDFIGGIQTVKVFAMEAFSLRKYAELNDRMANLERKSAKYDLSTRPIVHTLAMIFLILALVYGLYVLEMPVSDVLIFCGFLYLFYEPIKKFAEENSHIQRGISAAERMLEVINIEPKTLQEEGLKPFLGVNKTIEFKNVCFKYDREEVLTNVSFTVKKGEMVALVGPTGAGKSTLIQLLPRLYDVADGEILIDGVNIGEFDQKSLREHIAVVPQKPFLFLGSISENIRFGESFSDEEVIKAANKAHASEFIERLPEKYETQLSEGGKNLSGGQQQRLTIARALIKNASLLIMDEATSALDALSEHYIKETIHALKGKTTQIIIAHRLSTVEDADRIVYMEKGTIVDIGTKNELLSRCTGFKKLWDLMQLSS